MTKVAAGITISLDGYITGPDDGPGRGLGEGGERLHYWVFGGPWSHDEEPRGEPTGADKELLDEAMGRVGAVIGGRNTYEAAGAGFSFVGGLDEALAKAREAAGGKDVHVMGGADLIRQALASGQVEELTITIAPVVLGGGKRLFEGFEGSLELEHLALRQSPFATHITYRVLG